VLSKTDIYDQLKSFNIKTNFVASMKWKGTVDSYFVIFLKFWGFNTMLIGEFLLLLGCLVEIFFELFEEFLVNSSARGTSDMLGTAGENLRLYP
jgi:hypothetical protein